MSVIEKFRNFALAIKQNGGYIKSICNLYRVDDVKDGDLIGVDRNGNKYYQNKRYFVGNWIEIVNSSLVQCLHTYPHIKVAADGWFITTNMDSIMTAAI